MKKQNIINLIKYHVENNDPAFRAEATNIANEFDSLGDSVMAEYIMDLVSTADFFVPQSNYHGFKFLTKREYSSNSLFLPDTIQDDILGVARAINNKSKLSKFLFWGAPGTGKTESVYQIARLLDRDILTVNFEQLIDSHLGETSKNVSLLFQELKYIHSNTTIVLFDEIDALVLDRINTNDLREMGRVTSTFLRKLDECVTDLVIIATTNLKDNLDKALVRRFDATISFNRYASDDLIKIANELLSAELKTTTSLRKDKKLFTKILMNSEQIPYPGELKQIIRTAVGFSNRDNEYDYLRRIFLSLNNDTDIDITTLKNNGFSVREIELLTNISKSSIARKLNK